ncbi:MAG: winged helix-turn-helix transcriptional regulator [Eggerthellaceae bacterium]|nr:winged helix-turn-helix transcriptional regulator [Eggerthellaceae bacterium]
MEEANPRERIGADTLATMRDTALLFRAIVEPACRKAGLTLQQLYVLGELSAEPHQTAMELADRVGIRRTNFAGVCNKMVANGLITRERGVDDRRKAYLELTSEGEAAFDSVMSSVGERLDRASIVMGEQDYIAIRDGAESLRKLLQEATV